MRRQVTFGRFSSVMAAAACYARMCGRAEAMARQDEEESLVGHEAAVSQAAKGVHDARARVEAAELSAGDLKLAAAEAVRKDGAVAAEAAAAAAEAAAAAAAAAAAVAAAAAAATAATAATAAAAVAVAAAGRERTGLVELEQALCSARAAVAAAGSGFSGGGEASDDDHEGGSDDESDGEDTETLTPTSALPETKPKPKP